MKALLIAVGLLVAVMIFAPGLFAVAYAAGINGGIMLFIVFGVIIWAALVGTGDDRSDIH